MHASNNLGSLPCMDDSNKQAIIGWKPQRGWVDCSFDDIDVLANAIARALIGDGLVPQARVGVVALNSFEYVAAVLGIMRAGMIAVPINIKFPASTINGILEECEITHIFCDVENKNKIQQNYKCIVLDSDESSGLNSFVDYGPFNVVPVDAEDVALFLYTSGTTGRPKAVMLSHAGQRWVVDTRIEDFPETRNERFIVAAPLYHMNALALVFLTLGAGATCVLLPRFDSTLYAQGIMEWKCTWMTAVPPMIAMLLRDEATLSGAKFDSIEYVRLGSAVVTPQLREQIWELCPKATVINAYGTTESGPVTFLPATSRAAPLDTLGSAHPKVRVRLVDDSGNESNRGVLEIDSPSAMLGYYKRPDVASPFTHDGYYRTGDVFRRDQQGYYYFVGRYDDMFVCGGENIFPAEVEVALEKHPEIEQACVVPIDDEVKGSKPVAFVVRVDNSRLQEKEIQEFSFDVMPVYQYPRRVFFIDELPLAGTNKIDRAFLKQHAAELVGNTAK